MDIKSIIEEELLQESYKAILELKALANDALRTLAEINFKNIARENWENEPHISLEGVDLSQIKHKTPPVLLKKFVENVNLRIGFKGVTGFDEYPNIFDTEPQKQDIVSKTKGTYRYQNALSYGKNASTGKNDRIVPIYDEDMYKNILLTYDPQTFRKKIHSLKYDKFSQTPFTVVDLYSLFYFKFMRTLMHELRHAYDDYVSKSKGIHMTPQARKYAEKYATKNTESSLSVEKSLEKYKAYLNLPHEIWARFTAAFEKINFYKVDWQYGSDKIKVVVTMEPIQESIRDLKLYMDEFNALNQSAKQRLYKLVSAYWHKAKEELPAYQAMKQKQADGTIKSDLGNVDEGQLKGIHVDFANQQIKFGDDVIGMIQIFDRDNGYVILDKILIYPEARGNGYATAAMKQIMDKYRREGKILTLTPDNVYGANKNKLLKWYRSLGFVLNKGKNKDFNTMQLLYLPIS